MIVVYLDYFALDTGTMSFIKIFLRADFYE